MLANVFLDTSALLKRFVEEPGSDVVKDLLTDPVFRGRLFLARHAEAELISALNERYRQTQLSHRRVQTLIADFRRLESAFALVPLNVPVLTEAALVLNMHRNVAIHAGDAMHIAALRYAARTALANERVVLMTADPNMLGSTRRLGIETHNPEKEGLNLLKA